MSTKVFESKLENGMRLVGEYSDQAESCSIGALVRTGSRDEVPIESGISHFLEHMLFKGTKKRTAKDLNDRLGELGAQANAYTSVEQTVYYASVLSKFQNEYLELLSDMLRPKLDEDEFDMEKKVILEEIALKYDDPQSYFYMEAVSDYFSDHPIGNNVLGTNESVSAITIELMRDYFKRRYAPNNIVLSIAGKFDWESFCKEAEGLCGAWEPYQVFRETPELSFKSHSHQYQREGLNLEQMIFMLPAPSAQNDLRFTSAIWNNLIGDSSGSKLYWDLVEPGLVESLFSWSDDKDQAGVSYFYASCASENIEEVSNKIKHYIANPLEFSKQDLENAKTKIAARIAISSENTFNRMISCGEDLHYLGSVIELKDVIERINSVDQEQIEQLINEYSFENYAEYRLIKS